MARTYGIHPWEMARLTRPELEDLVTDYNATAED